MKEQQQQANKTKAIGISVVAIFGLAAVLAIAGLANTIGKLDDKVISRTPDAILASAGVNEKDTVSLPVAYYDQKSDPCINIYDTSKISELKKRQFEWTSCNYHNQELESGLAEFNLNDKYLPIATAAGRTTSNRGVVDFTRWFSSVDGLSQSYTGSLSLQYRADGAIFSYRNDKFYPLDDAKFSSDDTVNKDGHNHLFTMNFAVPFSVLKSGEESFSITADDDTFVYVGNALIIDMGGIHDATTGEFVIHDNGEIYSSIDGNDYAFSGVTLADADDSIVRIFHADRDSKDSIFNIEFSGMNLNIVPSTLADADSGIQIAYDPTDPSYIPPLGETSIFKPDNTRGYIIMATVFGVVIMALSILIAVFSRHILKQKQ